MNLQQRQSSPNPNEEPDDLEVTAELPVLDVATYEANVASAAAAADAHIAAAHTAREPDQLSRTDTWHIPAPIVRKGSTSE